MFPSSKCWKLLPACIRLNRLVENFLQMAKLEAGKVKLNIQPVRYSPDSGQQPGNFFNTGSEKNITLETHCRIIS
jgi:signal transduction histidine kinase